MVCEEGSTTSTTDGADDDQTSTAAQTGMERHGPWFMEDLERFE
jgi:hypothetical protein